MGLILGGDYRAIRKICRAPSEHVSPLAGLGILASREGPMRTIAIGVNLALKASNWPGAGRGHRLIGRP
jgi:hypothetical protein